MWKEQNCTFSATAETQFSVTLIILQLCAYLKVCCFSYRERQRGDGGYQGLYQAHGLDLSFTQMQQAPI